jgi:subtilisin family serine protease
MKRTSGSPELTIGLIDGPVASQHPDLVAGHLREIPGNSSHTCTRTEGFACLHGTFLAGILCARRGSNAPAICPGCTVLVRPIFRDPIQASDHVPSATPQSLALAIIECVDAGARVINLSLALTQASNAGETPPGQEEK